MDDTVEMNHCSCRKRVRDEKEKRDLMNRLRRIEGQVRGLQRMLDEDAWCPDILTQTSAVNSALNSFCKTLLASHLRTGSRLKKKATTPSKKETVVTLRRELYTDYNLPLGEEYANYITLHGRLQ